MCAKIANAAASLGLTGGVVDATHFSGVQVCASDPSTGITAPVVVELGNVTIQTNVPWHIQSSLFKIRGIGPGHTGLQYTGAETVAAILTLGTSAPTAPSSNFTNYQLEGFNIWGNSHVADGILAQGVHHSQFRDVSVWGVTGCGIHTMFAVSDTFANVHVSIFEAEAFGMAGSPTPIHGLCLDEYSANHQTTDGTVIDAVIEQVTGSGWYLPSASTMTFSAGTSEANAGGVEVGPLSTNNTFINADLESNQYDIVDAGTYELYLNPLSTSNVRFTGTASRSTIVGGTLNNLVIDSGASNVNYEHVSIGNNGGTVTNSGSGSNNAAAAGYSESFLPQVAVASIVNDSVTRTMSTQYFAPGAITSIQHLTSITNSSSWKAVFIGSWQNNYEGWALNPPAEIADVTSDSPELSVGSVTLRFSLDTSGHLQAENSNGSFAAVFTGEITLLPYYGNSSVGTNSIAVKGSLSGSVVRTTAAAPSSSNSTCTQGSLWSDANFVYVCTTTNTVKRVSLASF
jgi:hypothetical protein